MDRPTSPQVPMERWFNHVASPLMGVRPNDRGEFVQMWSAPRGAAKRFVTLSYQRTPNGSTHVSSRIDARTRKRHCDEILPCGRLLVSDTRLSLAIRQVWTDRYGWGAWKSLGRHLGDRAVLTRQREGATYFVATWQQQHDGDEVVSEHLVSVTEFAGKDVVRVVELADVEGAP